MSNLEASPDLCARVARAFPNERPSGHGLIAVSGGADSMALLHLLAALRQRFDLALTAAYVDHRTRDAAVIDAALVCATATRLGVRFELESVELPAKPRVPEHRSEAVLREQRYSALARVARRCRADWIATAHTRDDQVETILLRLFRGAGRAGLIAMRRQRGAILRPLLDVGRDELRQELRRVGLAWIEDPTNRDSRYARNRVRADLVPAVERVLGRGALDSLPRTARVFDRENAYLEAEVDRFFAYAALPWHAGPALDIAALAEVPAGLRPRLLRRWLLAAGATPSDVGVAQIEILEHLLMLTNGSRQVHIAGLCIVREYGTLRAEPLSIELEKEASERSVLPATLDLDEPSAWTGPGNAWRLEFEPSPRNEANVVAISPRHHVVDLARERLTAPLVLRFVHEGDWIRRKGGGRRKVHDIMVDGRIPRRWRARWPVLTANGEVVFVPGLAVAPDMESCGRGDQHRVRFAWRAEVAI